MNKFFKNFIIVFLLFLFGGICLDASLNRRLNRRKPFNQDVYRVTDSLYRRIDLLERELEAKDEEIFRLERELEELRNGGSEVQGEFPSYILLPDLLNLNLESFCKKFKDFLVSHISFYDFNSEKPGSSLYFFFTGLLSTLKGVEGIGVRVENLDSNSYIFDLLKNGQSFLKIYIKGVSKEEIENKRLFANKSRKFLKISNEEDCSVVKIIYNKHRIKTSYKVKDQDIQCNINKCLFDSFEQTRIFLSTIFLQEGFVKDLWSFYGDPETFDSEQDFHLFLYGIIANTNKLSVLNSNIERGAGRLDIMVKYSKITDRKIEVIKYVIELKKDKAYIKEKAELEMDKAFKQIDVLRYGPASPAVIKSDRVYVTAIVFNPKTYSVSFKEKDLALP
jgi:hypothetical protein